MKKTLLIAVVLLAGLLNKGFAQDGGGVRVGIKGGYSVAGWQGETVKSFGNLLEYTDGNVQTRMRQGFHAGAFLSIPLANGFEFEPGVQYSQKGMVLEGRIPGDAAQFANAKVTLTNKAEYIDVPLLAKVYVGSGFNFFAGPQVSFLLSNKVNVNAGAFGFSAYNNDFEWQNSQRKVDLGLSAGAGYQFQNGLNFGGSYDMGLTTIDQGADYKSYNHGFKASVGFRF
ncbi:porin family protein [Rufibacter latericius]|uniref:PorT family protein n=1 Tax=Rufibacter latericius TaxID=2487040 RepID=A0A3M9MLZ2_9BACT|nr:porin family protein [Rufibacter latericius]RNI25698.1 PorT family protein [Rufibacter latericius]